MRKSTKTALLLALFSQKASKKDEAFYCCASIIIVTLILIGATLESQFLFRTGLALILVVPFTRGAFQDYKKHKDTDHETVYAVLFGITAFSGFLFILGLAGSAGGLVTFSFLGLLAAPLGAGFIEGREQRN